MTADHLFRIVFFGTPDFAVPSLVALLESRHTVVAIVTQPDRPRGRGRHTIDAPVKRVAVAARVPLLQPDRLKNETFLASLRDLDADLGVVAAYGKILPEEVLNAPRLGMINVHASLLPLYRGAAPVHRAVMAGERVSGVTIMRVVAALDAGPILSRRERVINPEETSDVVEDDLARIGAELLIATIEDIAAGRAHEDLQDESAGTYAPRLTKADGLIDWSRSAREIHNQVRGLHPWPHAYSFVEGRRLIIHRTEIAPDRQAPAEPGQILDPHGGTLAVAAGHGSVLRILEIQSEGGRVMSTRDFLAGHPLRAGQRFSSG